MLAGLFWMQSVTQGLIHSKACIAPRVAEVGSFV